jgi:hypothetical protein
MHPLRQFIRQELTRIDEMPFAGVKSTVRGDPKGLSQIGALIASEPNHVGVDKYMQSNTWSKKADQAYTAFPYSVWIVPMTASEWDSKIKNVVSDKQLPNLVNGRRVLLPLGGQGAKALNILGVDTSDMSSDDLVIVAMATVTAGNFLPSPWMIFHALIDGDGPQQFGTGILEDMTDEIQFAPVDFRKNVLTMKSARDGVIGTHRDMVAEMICQELLTKSGLHFNKDGLNEEQLDYLDSVKQRIGFVAEKIMKDLRGKLLFASVA